MANQQYHKLNLLKHYPNLDSTTIMKAYTYTVNYANDPKACVMGYSKCNNTASGVYTVAVVACFASAVGLSVLLTPLGGIAYEVTCGGGALYKYHLDRENCALDYKICMLQRTK